MPLQTQKLGQALGESLTLHGTLCRREAGAFQKAIQSGQEVVVACTQEKKLFSELATQTEGATSPIKFVNIREAGGWSSDDKTPPPNWRRYWQQPICQNPTLCLSSHSKAKGAC